MPDQKEDASETTLSAAQMLAVEHYIRKRNQGMFTSFAAFSAVLLAIVAGLFSIGRASINGAIDQFSEDAAGSVMRFEERLDNLRQDAIRDATKEAERVARSEIDRLLTENRRLEEVLQTLVAQTVDVSKDAQIAGAEALAAANQLRSRSDGLTQEFEVLEQQIRDDLKSRVNQLLAAADDSAEDAESVKASLEITLSSIQDTSATFDRQADDLIRGLKNSVATSKATIAGIDQSALVMRREMRGFVDAVETAAKGTLREISETTGEIRNQSTLMDSLVSSAESSVAAASNLELEMAKIVEDSRSVLERSNTRIDNLANFTLRALLANNLRFPDISIAIDADVTIVTRRVLQAAGPFDGGGGAFVASLEPGVYRSIERNGRWVRIQEPNEGWFRCSIDCEINIR